ncbi:MAG: thiamine ABC transporter substrate-binding protein [Actinomycetaceae bacterium]|nr:thiamine ABC transporter substrate-binding protein [Actinomycetaceae bacterium]
MSLIRHRSLCVAAGAATAALFLTACTGGSAQSGGASGAAQSGGAQSGTAGAKITVLSHDSFEFPEELLTEFTEKTGITVTIQAVGDGGTLANQMVLSKDAPQGDVVYGIDNTVAYRLKGEKVIADAGITSPNAALDLASQPGLIPIDHGDVCVNFDKKWFEAKGLTPPASFEDLTKPEYKDLLVAMNPASSTPGMAFMLSTINHFGEDKWAEYWKGLKNNGLKVTSGWSDAFSVDYSAGEGAGLRPMMVSYGSSPAYSVTDDGSATTTGAIPATCYRQVEYAGVIEGSESPEAAAQFVEYMLTPKVQEAISEVTYMYPVNPEAKVPETLTTFGPLTEKPVLLPADKVAEKSEEWLKTWQDTVQG